MTQVLFNTNETVFVGLDIAKATHQILVECPNGKRKSFKIPNTKQGHQMLIEYLQSLKLTAVIGFEATANYHRTVAYALQTAGFSVYLISALAAARTREALHNSWDKNDPKDAQVILHLLKTGIVQTYHDPLVHDYNDVQEISKTYHQFSLHKVRIQHSIMNHYLPLYFPEAERYFHSTRAQWFTSFLLSFPHPNMVTQYTLEEFIEYAWEIAGRKVAKKHWLTDFYYTAKESCGLPLQASSHAIHMFKLVLQQHQNLCQLLKEIEQIAKEKLITCPDYKALNTIPGIGPILALTILSEAGDLKRFKHYRQFLKFCGFDLCTHQSGYFRGQSKLSKYGNSRLRYAFWIAATVAIRMRENTFRNKYERYIKQDPTNADLKRKAYTAVAAKMARVAYSVVKNQTDYRCTFESVIPSGRIASVGP